MNLFERLFKSQGNGDRQPVAHLTWAKSSVGRTVSRTGLFLKRQIWVWPILAVALSPWLGWAAGTVSVALGVTVAVLSWHRSVQASYHPPLEVGTTFPIPPELAPHEVLDAAEIDDTGRPR